MPTLWFRNNWSWGHGDYKPQLKSNEKGQIEIHHESLSPIKLYARNQKSVALFCNNESNPAVVPGASEEPKYYKDGINNFLIHKDENAVNTKKKERKQAFLLKQKLKVAKVRLLISV